MGKVGRAFRFAGGLTGPVGRQFVTDRLRHASRTGHESATQVGRQRRRARHQRDTAMRAPTGRDRGLVLPLPVSVVLPPWSPAAYRTDPEALWAGIGSTVEVQVVPGVERMMPREPV